MLTLINNCRVFLTGHWLGLLHTFDGGCDVPGGGDRIGDTPYSAEVSLGHGGASIFACIIRLHLHVAYMLAAARSLTPVVLSCLQRAVAHILGFYLQASYDCKRKNTCPHVWGQDPIHNPMNYSPDQCMTQVSTPLYCTLAVSLRVAVQQGFFCCSS